MSNEEGGREDGLIIFFVRATRGLGRSSLDAHSRRPSGRPPWRENERLRKALDARNWRLLQTTLREGEHVSMEGALDRSMRAVGVQSPRPPFRECAVS